MEPSLPEWATKEFFEQSLRKEEGNNNIVVTNLTASSAVPPGNNYGSYIIRVELEWKISKVDSELKTSKFIVKAELTDGPMKEMTTEFILFEPSFYYNFIPKAKEFSDVSFAAKSFFSPRPSVTILEDLKEKGFVMADRTKLLDFDHCRLYMRAAASFHSVSVPVFKKYPEILKPINKEFMFSNESKTAELFSLLIKGGMKKLIEEIQKVERYKKYTNTLKDLTPHLWDMVVEANKPREVVNTIKQGDPWVTNMMFKYDKDNKVCDVKLIDFQATGYGSPVSDVMVFLWSSANFDVRQNRMDDLYRIYVDIFNENLRNSNCPERLTYEEMVGNVKKLSSMALFVSSAFLPGAVHSDPMDFTGFFSEDRETKSEEVFEKYYSDDYCTKFLPHVFESLETNGIFSYLENHKKM